ncbi:MAG: exodeoxyribonuclease V subunit gamma [Rhodocyclaceae bacterium]
MLSLAFSNRQEVLLGAMLERLSELRPGPLGVREVIVPNSAMRRAVELAVADREGVAADLAFSYPAQWVWTQIGRVVAVPEVSPFSPARLAWRVFALLGDAAAWAAQPRLAAYLGGADAVMRFELAERIARLFDNYITYRPQWLAEWSAGRRLPGLADSEREDEAWQAALWRRLTAEMGIAAEHPMAAFFRAVEQAGPQAAPGLPEEVQVFCLPALPPLYLDILRKLSRWMNVRMYVLNPCREYWFEIVPERRLSWLIGQQRALYHEVGNRLLANWGRQTQAAIDLLFEDGAEAEVEDSRFVASGRASLLGAVQDAILELEDPPPGSVALAPADRSIEVHLCHSLTRELEVLHDRLLGLFAGSRAPRADEVLVVTPDLERAAPLIEAVFGAAPPERRIPWRISGLGETRANPVARVLDQALGLLGGRMPASEVFGLLQLDPVAERFGLDGEDLARVHDWLERAGVRWGLDGAHRASLGLPHSDAHTFGDGLHRLFLAYAWGDGEAEEVGQGSDEGEAGGGVFAGRIGAANPEGAAAALLGRLWRYVDSLRVLQRACAEEGDIHAWRARLFELLDRLVAPSLTWADDLRAVRGAISALHADAAAASAGGGGADAAADPLRLPLALLHTRVRAVLDEAARGGVATGVVTFTAISSLRNLPHKVICAVGLDDDAFPGSDRPAEFDLMVRRPARGDRQRALDERNLFLDLLLAAREVLHLSFTGRSVRDNSEKPPSVLVDELLDYCARLTCADHRDPAALAQARRRLVVEHPLQGFSPRYFVVARAEPGEAGEGADPRLASYNRDYCEALRARLQAAADVLAARGATSLGDAAWGGGHVGSQSEDGDPGSDEDATTAAAARFEPPARPFFAAPLPPPEVEWQRVALADLVRYFRNPARYLLRDRLGVSLPDGDEELRDDEPFTADWLGRQALAERLLPRLMALPSSDAGARPAGEEAVLALAEAGREYPSGPLGRRLLAHELVSLRAFVDGLRPALAEAPRAPSGATLAFDLAGESWVLASGSADLRSHGWVGWRYADARASDYVSAWLHHLALCATAPAGVAAHSQWHARDGVFRFRTCADAPEHLRALLGLYREGLRRPLPFFPKSAWEWARNGHDLGKARAKWSGGRDPAFAECNDPAIRLAFRGVADPLDEHFEAVAATLLDPLLAHLQPEEGHHA